MTDTPTVEVIFRAEAVIGITLDLVSFYREMNASERSVYLAWTDDDFWDGSDSLKPIAYLMWRIDQDAELNPGIWRGDAGYVRDHSEITNWDAPKLRSTYKRWTSADFETLMAAVPWMDRSQPDSEEVKRLPGPDDRPLF